MKRVTKGIIQNTKNKKGKIRSVDLESYYNLMVLLHVNIRLIF